MAGVRLDIVVRNQAGRVQPTAQVRIYHAVSATLIDLFSDAALTTPKAQPLTVDEWGRVEEAYVAAGTYRRRVTFGTTPATISDEYFPYYAGAPGETVESTSDVPWFNVRDYGAVGDGVTDDTEAFHAAREAAEANVVAFVGTGIVYVPAGIYALSEALVTADFAVVSYLGDGPYASVLYWTEDLGSGNHAISDEWTVNDTTDSFVKRRFIQDLALLGGNEDTDTQAGSGVKLTTGMVMERCVVSFFNQGYGVDCWGNHQTISKCKIRGNDFGVNIEDSDFALGDQYIHNTMLTSNYTASVRIAGGSLAVFEMEDVHMGFSPYGIWCEPDAAAALSQCTFHKCYCESFGNAFICTNDRVINSISIRDTTLRRNDVYENADDVNAIIDCGDANFQHNILDNVNLDLASGATLPPAFIASGSCVDNTFHLSEDGVLGYVLISDWPLVAANNEEVARNELSWGAYRAHLHRSQGTLVQNDAVEFVSFLGTDDHMVMVRRGTAGGIPAGIAYHAAAANDVVLVAFEGPSGPMAASGAIAELDKVTLAASGAVKTAIAGDDILGIARGAAASSLVKIFLKTDWLA